MDIRDVKAKSFYRVSFKARNREGFIDCIVKCTRIDDFDSQSGYSVYHFKTLDGELVVADYVKKEYNDYFSNSWKSRYLKILIEIKDYKWKNTSIEFLAGEQIKDVGIRNKRKI